MIAFDESLAEFMLATFIPIYVGMFLVLILSSIARVKTRYLCAFALGILFWFFFDTANDAVQLGVNEGYTFDFRQTGLVLLFITGFLLLTLLSGRDSGKERNGKGMLPLLQAILVALGLAIHGVGEGLQFGGLASGTQAGNVLDAIGGAGGGIAYILHKLLESSLVIIVFISMARANGLSLRPQIWQTMMVGLAFGIPSALGEVVGYYVPVDSSYFFAMGAGVALSVALIIVRPIFAENGEGRVAYSQWVGISLATLLGFFLLYGAALFHS